MTREDDEAKAKLVLPYCLGAAKSVSQAHDEDDDAMYDHNGGPLGAVDFNKEASRRKKKALSLTHGNQDWRSNKLYLSGGAYAHWRQAKKQSTGGANRTRL